MVQGQCKTEFGEFWESTSRIGNSSGASRRSTKFFYAIFMYSSKNNQQKNEEKVKNVHTFIKRSLNFDFFHLLRIIKAYKFLLLTLKNRWSWSNCPIFSSPKKLIRKRKLLTGSASNSTKKTWLQQWVYLFYFV